MRVRDIAVQEVRAGKVWRVLDADGLGADDLRLEELQIAPADSFASTDYVVYSALLVADSGRVRPLLLIKEVGGYDYGGDYCERHEGEWRQLGLVANPDAEYEQEYIANPLNA